MAEARAGTGFSWHPDPRLATAEATVNAFAHLNALGPGKRCDLAIAFASGAVARDPTRLTQAIRDATGARFVVGCTCDRALSDGGDGDGLAVMLTRGTSGQVHVCHEASKDPVGAGRLLARRLGGRGALQVWLDPNGLHARALLDALHAGLPPGVPVTGGAASGAPPALFPRTHLGHGPRAGWASDSVVGLRVGGAQVVWGLSQARQPIAEPLEVTGVHGPVLRALDGRPALDAVERLLPRMVEDLDRLGESVLLARQRGLAGGRSHFRYLPITGVEPATGGLRLGAQVELGERLVFTLRDGAQARRDMRRMLDDLRRRAPKRPAFGLFIEDTDRASITDDADAVRAAFPDLPWIGWRGPMVVAPVEARPRLSAHGAMLVLFS